MNKFRIISHEGRFKIQQKGFLFWSDDIDWCHGFIVDAFVTNELAEEFIDNLILDIKAREIRRKKEKVDFKVHKLQNPPYEYPKDT